MSASLAAAPGLVKPRFLHVPEYHATLGGEVGDVARQAGFGPDPEQQLALDAIFGLDRRGRVVANEGVLIACRQNLKTGTFKQAALGWMFVQDIEMITWSAHRWDTATLAFMDLDAIISGTPWLSRQVRTVHRGERDQEFVTRRGSHLRFMTRSAGAGAGLTGRRIVLDEGWALRWAQMGLLLPTLSAMSVTADPQVLIGSSAGRVESEVLRDVRNRGRSGEPDMFYMEYCAPDPAEACERGEDCDHGRRTPGCGCDRPVYWLMGNPLMGRRISQEHIAGERRKLIPAEFGRERMGWWDPGAEEQDADEALTVEAWEELAQPRSEPEMPIALALVYARGRKTASIGLAGRRADGLWHVELADKVPVPRAVARTVQLARKYEVCGVGVDGHSHESSEIPKLKTELGDDMVVVLSATEVAQAYGLFVDAATASAKGGDQALAHRGQAEMSAAVMSAQPRDIGDAGQAWGRKASGGDIGPIVAVTNAMWVHEVMAPAAQEPGAWEL